MKRFKKLSMLILLVFALIDIKIIVNYEVTKPTEKYNIIDKKKTVAKVLDLSTIHPKEVIETNLDTQNTKEQIDKTELNTEKNDEQVTNEIIPTIEQTIENTQNEEPVTENIDSTPTAEDNNTQENSTQSPEESSQEEQPVEASSNSSDIVETAKSYLGCSYVSGGSSPSGFDCSGFTKYVYGQYGITLNRTAADQAENGTPINKDELQPGDLLLFSYYGSSGIGHTGIYIGDGQFVHAANSNRGVVTDTIESGYYQKNYVGARRLQ